MSHCSVLSWAAWRLGGHVRHRIVAYHMRCYWVLDRQFLRLSVKHPTYRATGYVGYDHVAGELVAHWLDWMGGRSSASIGKGADWAKRCSSCFSTRPASRTHVHVRQARPGRRAC